MGLTSSLSRIAPLLLLPGLAPVLSATPMPWEDCNGNGIPDAREIATGLTADCQGDGIPDECQLEDPYRYAVGDGQMNGSLGSLQQHVAWMTRYTVLPGREVITDVELAWGTLPTGYPVNLCLWSDPNGDGDPDDAVLLMSHVAHAIYPQTGIVVSVDIPDTHVGSPRDSFFIGAYGTFSPYPTHYPGALDEDTGAYESWWITSDTPIDPNDLTRGAIVDYGPLGSYCPCDGDWMFLALACRGGHCGESADTNGNSVPDECEDCNGNGLPDDIDIANGTSTDCDGDAVPDECVLPDCDGNGHADLCQALAGQGLAGEYYPNKTLSGAPLPRIDSAIAFDFEVDPPFPGLFPENDFSVRWTGSVLTGAAGTYVFGVDHNRGARLWVDGVLLVDDWWNGNGFHSGAIALAGASEYYVCLEYFAETGASYVELSWQPPGGNLVVIPPTSLRPLLDRDLDGIPDPCQFADCNGNGIEDLEDIVRGLSSDCDGDLVPDECQPCADCDKNGLLDDCELTAGSGLVGQYWASYGGAGKFSERRLVRIDPDIDFDWAGSSPAFGVPADEFAVRWTGTLTTPAVTGTYQLHVRSDDGVRFWLDRELLVDEWHPSSGNVYTVYVPLSGATDHLFELDYYEGGGDARIFVRWTVPGQPEVPIPSSAFRPDSDANGDGLPDLCVEDCDLDLVPDVVDLAHGTLVDTNGNCIPDACEGGAGYWRFEEAGGATIVDSTPLGNDGSLNARAIRISDVPVDAVPLTGAANLQSLDLDWASVTEGGLAKVPDFGGYLSSGATSFTLEAWVRLDQLGSSLDSDQRQWLFQKKPLQGSDALMDYGFLVQAGNLGNYGNELAFRCGDGVDGITVASSLRIVDLGWHLVSLAYDAPQKRLRFGLDGTYQFLPFTKPDITTVEPLVIGAHTNQSGLENQFVRGKVDEVRLTRAFLPPELLLSGQ